MPPGIPIDSSQVTCLPSEVYGPNIAGAEISHQRNGIATGKSLAVEPKKDVIGTDSNNPANESWWSPNPMSILVEYPLIPWVMLYIVLMAKCMVVAYAAGLLCSRLRAQHRARRLVYQARHLIYDTFRPPRQSPLFDIPDNPRLQKMMSIDDLMEERELLRRIRPKLLQQMDMSCCFRSPNSAMTYDDKLMKTYLNNHGVICDCKSMAENTSHYLKPTGSSVEMEINQAAHYEAFVHPALFAHPNVEFAAVVTTSGNMIDGIAVVREVLKHKEVGCIKLIILGVPVFPLDTIGKVNDCSDLVGIEDLCLGDPRVEVEIVHLPKNNSLPDFDGILPLEEHFDVVFFQPFQYKTYTDNFVEYAPTLTFNVASFLQYFLDNLLTSEGIVAMPLGDSPFLSDSLEKEERRPRMKLIMDMENLSSEVESLHIYEESRAAFSKPQAYSVLCASWSCRKNWYNHEASMKWVMASSLRHSQSGRPVLHYFDDSVMQLYRNHPKSWDSMFCRRRSRLDQIPVECGMQNGFDPAIPNIYRADFELKVSSLGKHVGFGLFPKVNISAPAYLMQDVGVHTVHFPPCTIETIDDLLSADEIVLEKLFQVLGYLYGYGWQSDALGGTAYFVESGIGFLVNHGCNGTYNTASHLESSDIVRSEMEADPNNFPFDDVEGPLFNPILSRHLEDEWAYSDMLTRDVKAGEEIFSNYLEYISDEKDWKADVEKLRAVCRGELKGHVTFSGKEKASEKLKRIF